MPAWQGSVADTILYLIRHEGKNPEQAAAIAHSLAEDEGASKAVMAALKTRAGVKGLDDASLLSAHKRLHAWALSSNGDAQVFERETTEAHSWLIAEMVAREIEHKLYDGLDKAAHRAEQAAVEKFERGSWIVKQEVGEQRYTLSVAYPVDQLDKHGEFMTADDLEKAAWRYMTGSRRVGIMHEGRGDKGTGGAGEIVESYIYRGPDWHIAGEIVRDGDWLVGIIWDEAAWQSIKAGNYTGLSFQGLVSSSSAEAPKHAPPA